MDDDGALLITHNWIYINKAYTTVELCLTALTPYLTWKSRVKDTKKSPDGLHRDGSALKRFARR